MVQIYILRADMSPLDASRSGADASICGDCRHRGIIHDDAVSGRTCYVNLAHGPRMAYLMATTARYIHADLETGAELLRGRTVRLVRGSRGRAVPSLASLAFLCRGLDRIHASMAPRARTSRILHGKRRHAF
jgi:hypothetical protein